MRQLLPGIVLLLFVAGCSRPSSREYFMLREDAEYGDSYSFILDMSDSSASYGLDFFTRLEKRSFGEFPEEDIMLDIRWFSPLDSILTDTLFLSLAHPSGSAYYTKDFIFPYKDPLELPGAGEWRLKARIVNDSQTIRGLGVIFRNNGTR